MFPQRLELSSLDRPKRQQPFRKTTARKGGQVGGKVVRRAESVDGRFEGLPSDIDSGYLRRVAASGPPEKRVVARILLGTVAKHNDMTVFRGLVRKNLLGLSPAAVLRIAKEIARDERTNSEPSFEDDLEYLLRKNDEVLARLAR